MSRICQCVDWLGANDDSEPNPLAVRLSSRKRRQAPRRSRYKKLVAEAEHAVPASVQRQIQLDATRSLGSLPWPRPGSWGWGLDPTSSASKQQRVESLCRILAAYEWRATCRLSQEVSDTIAQETQLSHSDRTSSEAAPSVYVQGCSLMAAMCLGFTAGNEEDAFWLLQHLSEDVLGDDFLARYPPLLGYHGDCAAAAAMVADEAPELTRALGPVKLAEFVKALCARCLLSGFVGFLSDGPLLALWEELLQGHERFAVFPRYAMLRWLAGLVQHLQADLLVIADRTSAEELLPAMFKQTQQVARALPDRWQPICTHAATDTRVREMRSVSEEASRRHFCSFQEQQLRESHAKLVWESLDRAALQLQEAVQYAQAVIPE